MDLPATERRADAGRALDQMTPRELARTFAEADAQAARAVADAGDQVAAAIDLAHQALTGGGRIVLTGAGTSGRLAVIEAAECWPTFSSRQVVGLMAGGEGAFVQAREGAEDDRDGGAREAGALGLGEADLLIGIAASGRTPFVLGSLDAARSAGAKTAFVCCSPPSEPDCAQVIVELATGPEVLTGSTRLKAGTATKCVLNAISTGSMALAGKVMDDLMVDVVPSNAKLKVRAARIVAELTGTEPAAAQKLLEDAGGVVKTAVVMGRLGLGASDAQARLAAAGGHLRRALSPQ